MVFFLYAQEKHEQSGESASDIYHLCSHFGHAALFFRILFLQPLLCRVQFLDTKDTGVVVEEKKPMQARRLYTTLLLGLRTSTAAVLYFFYMTRMRMEKTWISCFLFFVRSESTICAAAPQGCSYPMGQSFFWTRQRGLERYRNHEVGDDNCLIGLIEISRSNMPPPRRPNAT